MQNVVNLFIRRPIFASMIILAMVVVGSSAYTKLGVDRFPSVDVPTVSVRTRLPGASSEEVESELSDKIEEVTNTVSGLDELRSISTNGNAIIIATFNLNRDIDSATQDVRDKVATVIKQLPDKADPPTISKFDNDSQPVVTFSLSGDMTLRDLTELADKTVKKALEPGEGVGEVSIVGGTVRTINIDVDPDRLASFSIPISAVGDAVRRQNTEVPGGNVTGVQKEQSLRTMGRIENSRDFSEIIIKYVNGAPVRLKDVAKVADGSAEMRSVARLNGKPSVSLEIRRQSGANTIRVIDSVKKLADSVRDKLPPGVKLEVIRDQSNYINNALSEINQHLIVGSILACLVVLAFTRSWRSTIIAGIAIPSSVISTFGMMWLLDFTLNSVTMLALVLMVGIVIDDAIVVLENIFRFIEEKKMNSMEAARLATGEIATAVLATTLSLAIIFVPVSFMSSISGRFLYQFGITAAVAVMVSLVVSFVLTPTLSARMLAGEAAKKRDSHHGSGSRGGFYHYLDLLYTWMLLLVMKHRVISGIFAILIALSSIPLFGLVPQGYLPQGQDEAEFNVTVTAPESISFIAMDDVMKKIEADISKDPRVTAVLSTVGSGFVGAVNSGDIYVRIPPHETRYFSVERFLKSLWNGHPSESWTGNYTQTDVMQSVQASLRKFGSKSLKIRVANYAGFNIGGGNFDIDFSVTGPDLKVLASLTKDLVARGEAIGGYNGLDTTLKLDKPELLVHIDRDRANDLGITTQEIGTALNLMVGGDQEVSDYRDNSTNEDYDVRLRLQSQFRQNLTDIPRLMLSTGDGRLVELSNLATVEPSNTAARVDRLNRGRDARVRGMIAPGYSLEERTRALLNEVKEMNLPPGYSVSVRGKGREFERTYKEFGIAFLMSILFMYMILASQYESLIDPLTILLSLPLSVPFALLSLYIMGEQLNLYSALGILVLFGVVKKNAILQIDHMNQLRQKGMSRAEAVIQGNRDRLRPILMTTLSLVAGMLPMAIGTGPGAEERRAVATAVIGGQMLSLLLTLLMTPVAYTLIEDILGFRGRRSRAVEPVQAQPVAK